MEFETKPPPPQKKTQDSQCQRQLIGFQPAQYGARGARQSPTVAAASGRRGYGTSPADGHVFLAGAGDQRVAVAVPAVDESAAAAEHQRQPAAPERRGAAIEEHFEEIQLVCRCHPRVRRVRSRRPRRRHSPRRQRCSSARFPSFDSTSFFPHSATRPPLETHST